MCELLAESLSDTDEDISQQNMFNTFLNIVTIYQSGARLEAFLTTIGACQDHCANDSVEGLA